MKILVTGGSGRLGKATIAELTAHGHEAINADQAPPAEDGRGTPVRFIKTDLTDIGQVAGALHGCDAVIHLGAIPAPYRHPDEHIFINNTQSTFAVLHAASLLGIKRAALASSVSAYGMAWTNKPFGPLYAPLDEDHPLLVHDPYGLSKEVDERTAAMIHRRTGMTIACLRFHWIALPEELAWAQPDGIADPSGMKNNLWGYVDLRDAAAACRLAIEAEFGGSEAFNIVGVDTLCGQPTEDLIAQYLPETELRAPIAGHGGGFAIEKAARVLGWRPQHSWRDGQG
jgi:nucleoside-diphosphate-sugar epimerase